MAAMSDLSQTPFFSITATAHPGVPKVAEQAYLGLVASLGGLAAAALLIFAVATQSAADAERIAGAEPGSVTTLVAAFAATHGRPGGR
jgi:hypothetical protein